MLNMFYIRGFDPKNCRGVIISSVVPEVTFALGKAAKLITGCEPIYVNSRLDVGLEILTDNPTELGADMIVGSVAAKAKYGLPLLVMDLGTATKLYVLDNNGAFIGCAIAAGVGTALNALSSGASQLPAIALTAPPKAICTQTVQCMQSGAVFGTASMLDGMIDRFESELGYRFSNIIATGGYSSSIISHCSHNVIADNDLLLCGLKYIFEMNEDNKHVTD